MLRSEKRPGYQPPKPPRKKFDWGNFIYALVTLVLLVVLFPVGLIMLWRRKLRWQGHVKLLSTLVGGCAFILFAAFLITVPVENENLRKAQNGTREALASAQEFIVDTFDRGVENVTRFVGGAQSMAEKGATYVRARSAALVYSALGEVSWSWIDTGTEPVPSSGPNASMPSAAATTGLPESTIGATPAPTMIASATPTPAATQVAVASIDVSASTPIPTMPPIEATNVPFTPEPTGVLAPTPAPTVAPVTVNPALLPKIDSMNNAVVYYTTDGTYYHRESVCGSMSNGKAHTLSEAISKRKQSCPWCLPVTKDMIDTPEAVWVNDDTKLIHISAVCEQLASLWTAMTLTDALSEGGRPCEECGAYHYVNKLAFHSDDSLEPITTTGDSAREYGDVSTLVYTSDRSKYFHKSATCANLSGLAPITLGMVSTDKQPCPECNPPILKDQP